MLLKNETLETVHLKQNRLFRGMHSKLKSFKKLPATNPVKVIMNGAQYAPPTPRLKNNPEDKKKEILTMAILAVTAPKDSVPRCCWFELPEFAGASTVPAFVGFAAVAEPVE